MSEQLLVPLPLEKLGFSEHLNGEFGTNRPGARIDAKKWQCLTNVG